MTDYLSICKKCRLELYDEEKGKCWGCVDMIPQLDKQVGTNYTICQPCLNDPHEKCKYKECVCICKQEIKEENERDYKDLF